jgi:hypothetical protein
MPPPGIILGIGGPLTPPQPTARTTAAADQDQDQERSLRIGLLIDTAAAKKKNDSDGSVGSAARVPYIQAREPKTWRSRSD